MTIQQVARDSPLEPFFLAFVVGKLGCLRSEQQALADVNAAQTDDGMTAAAWAAQKGYVEILDLLLTSGADPNAAQVHLATSQNIHQNNDKSLHTLVECSCAYAALKSL